MSTVETNKLDDTSRWSWVLLTGFLAAVCALAVIGRLYRRETERVNKERENAAIQRELAETRAELLKKQEAEDIVLESIRETAEHGYMALDGEGRVIHWNPGMKIITGRDLAYMEGKTLREVMEEEDYQAHSKHYPGWIKDPATDDKVLRLNCRLLHTNGRHTNVIVTARKVIVEGSEPYAIGLVDRQRDVIDMTHENRGG
jgi:PAS domain S-box-containing protein